MHLLLSKTGGVGAAVIPALFPQVPAIATYRTNTMPDTIEMAGLTFHSSHSANLNGAKLDNERISFAGRVIHFNAGSLGAPPAGAEVATRLTPGCRTRCASMAR